MPQPLDPVLGAFIDAIHKPILTTIQAFIQLTDPHLREQAYLNLFWRFSACKISAEDQATVKQWVEETAKDEHNLTPAKQIIIGLAHLHGVGVHRDFTKGRRAIIAAKADPYAEDCLGAMLFCWPGYTQNRSMGTCHFENSALARNTTINFWLYYTRFNYGNKELTEADRFKHFNYYEQIASAGCVNAIYILGTMYKHGYHWFSPGGVPDPIRAAHYYSAAFSHAATHHQKEIKMSLLNLLKKDINDDILYLLTMQDVIPDEIYLELIHKQENMLNYILSFPSVIDKIQLLLCTFDPMHPLSKMLSTMCKKTAFELIILLNNAFEFFQYQIPAERIQGLTWLKRCIDLCKSRFDLGFLNIKIESALEALQREHFSNYSIVANLHHQPLFVPLAHLQPVQDVQLPQHPPSGNNPKSKPSFR